MTSLEDGLGRVFAQVSVFRRALDKGIGHVYIKPRTPRLNGKVERSHRIDAEEFYRLFDGVVIDDVNVFNARLKQWQDHYNYDRPHGGLDGQTPYERLRQKTQARGPGVVDQRQSHKREPRNAKSHEWPRLGSRTSGVCSVD